MHLHLVELWIIFSVVAAAAQTLRFAVQKSLASGSLSAAAATWARFLWSWPVAILLVASYGTATGAIWPDISPGFLAYGLTGGVFQILATICTVSLFKSRAFAVGITFKKTEVMLTALVGFVLSGPMEQYFWLTNQIHGWSWLGRPGVLIIGNLFKAAGVGLILLQIEPIAAYALGMVMAITGRIWGPAADAMVYVVMAVVLIFRPIDV